MKPIVHIATSFSLSVGLWFFTKSAYAALLCFVSGFLIDFDHAVEYFLHYGFKDFSFKRIYQVSSDMLFEKLHLFLHAGEIVILLWVAYLFTDNIYLLGIAVGYSSHLILDFAGNPLHVFSYFLIRRFMKGFETELLVRKDHPRWLERNQSGKN
jgi:hypothetical protein